MVDPDLQIRWGRGGDHPDPDIRGGGAVSKKNVSALWASVWSKNKGGGRPPPLDPPLLNVFYNKFRLYKSCVA